MNIALIDDEPVMLDIIKSRISDVCSQCTIQLFAGSEDFGKADLDQFDVIVADYRLGSLTGKDLLKTISTKSKAYLILISAYEPEVLAKGGVEDYIDGFVSKSNIPDLIDHIKYVHSKIKINNLLDVEEVRIANLISENGYSVEVNKDIMIIGLSCALDERARNVISDQVNKNHYSGIVFFADPAVIGSALLKELIILYKLFNDDNRKFCFWNAYKQEEVRATLTSCNIDNLIQIFDSIDSAMEYITKK